MRTIIAGSRDANKVCVFDAINRCKFKDEITLVVSGTAKGADKHGEQWAIEHKIPIEQYPPDWKAHGLKAGPIRNMEMARNAQALIAIWDGKSKGTKNVIACAEKIGLKIFVYRTDRVFSFGETHYYINFQPHLANE